PGRYGLALLEISTGELLAAELRDSASVLAELVRVEPREVLIERGNESLRAAIKQVFPAAHIRDDYAIDDTDVSGVFRRVLSDAAIAEANASVSSLGLRASGRALRFALRCNPGTAIPIQRIVAVNLSHALQIDDVAQSHLEIVRASDGSKRGTLLSVVDRTVTSPGARLLRRWLLAPLADRNGIRQRQDAVDAFVQDAVSRAAFREAIRGVGDFERLGSRAVMGELSPRDLGVLRDSLVAVPVAFDVVARMQDVFSLAGVSTSGLSTSASSMSAFSVSALSGATLDDSLLVLRDLLVAALVDRPPATARDGGIIREGFDSEFDETGQMQRQGADLMIAMEANLRASVGIPNLKVRYTRVFGWYIEVSKSHIAKVPREWRRKQTVAGAERFSSDSLDDVADRLAHAEERHSQREAALFADLVAKTTACASLLRALGNRLAMWDVFSSLAEVAHSLDYVRPVVDDSDVIDIKDGRHPVVEQLSAAGRFVPNDICLDVSGERLWLLTGPNMAGKSTFMRQVVLIVLLAQAGSFVPARSARIGIVDRILSRVGANDHLSRGESTFMVEMRETASILKQATSRSLVILDEIGRGTSTYDGLAIAWAVAEHLHDVVRCRTAFATHYHELTEFAEGANSASNYSVSAREYGEDVVFLYKVVQGAASRSYGVAVARLAGVSESVLTRAKAILGSLESGGALPGGRYATLRGRTRQGAVQLDLFSEGPRSEVPRDSVAAVLREVDPNNLSPIEAFQLVLKLRAMLG
ncbi:MAG: DNA mismatch repair protein MutS, partial [Polyangiaceae bacterium]|nr:DNA mismatch repair protein MutS [Polyangiaceae bacterium]